MTLTKAQIVDIIPTAETDLPVDKIVTEDRVIIPSNQARD